MERSVEVLAIILFGVLGLSHILQPKAWAEFFILLRGKGEAGVFVDGFLNLPLAGIIIGFHNIWSGIPAVLTLVGGASSSRACFGSAYQTRVDDDGAGVRGAVLGGPGGWCWSLPVFLSTLASITPEPRRPPEGFTPRHRSRTYR
jgi:hypothetical protein